ncbi:hypothetical protein TYRP_002629 [Tyrophagus putrescentiae]|nr:hypothetical protein TYRP_002629 [Tyrophagus putrescentiae]
MQNFVVLKQQQNFVPVALSGCMRPGTSQKCLPSFQGCRMALSVSSALLCSVLLSGLVWSVQAGTGYIPLPSPQQHQHR